MEKLKSKLQGKLEANACFDATQNEMTAVGIWKKKLALVFKACEVCTAADFHLENDAKL